MMKYFVFAGVGSFIALVCWSAIMMFFNYFRGRYVASKLAKAGDSLETASPEPDNMEFTCGFTYQMHREKLRLGTECECAHCETD